MFVGIVKSFCAFFLDMMEWNLKEGNGFYVNGIYSSRDKAIIFDLNGASQLIFDTFKKRKTVNSIAVTMKLTVAKAPYLGVAFRYYISTNDSIPPHGKLMQALFQRD